MNDKDLLARITVNPEVMVGKPAIRGLRITVEQILKALAADISITELLEDYPEIEMDDIKAERKWENGVKSCFATFAHGIPCKFYSHSSCIFALFMIVCD
ncbi:MAG: DUF433 domain-containing protein [Candidatus Aminicenantes bacterium]|nr:DUF433 domain-containing protein [Candidatus Aminicenantes bacterium]